MNLLWLVFIHSSLTVPMTFRHFFSVAVWPLSATGRKEGRKEGRKGTTTRQHDTRTAHRVCCAAVHTSSLRKHYQHRYYEYSKCVQMYAHHRYRKQKLSITVITFRECFPHVVRFVFFVFCAFLFGGVKKLVIQPVTTTTATSGGLVLLLLLSALVVAQFLLPGSTYFFRTMGRPADNDSVQACAINGDEARLKLLMGEEGFNLQETYTRREWTLLHFAMSGGHVKCIDAVLEAANALSVGPALLAAKDALGFTPFRLAKQKRYVDVVLYMESKGLAEK